MERDIRFGELKVKREHAFLSTEPRLCGELFIHYVGQDKRKE